MRYIIFKDYRFLPNVKLTTIKNKFMFKLYGVAKKIFVCSFSNLDILNIPGHIVKVFKSYYKRITQKV